MRLIHPFEMNSRADSASVETRQRLLEAAGEVFVERGFRQATVRDICRRARANVAAVNYHFRGKAGLYSAILRYAHHCATEKYPPHLGLGHDATPEERLRAYVRAFLLRIFDEGRHAWHGKLMSREMIEPTSALDKLVNDQIRPRAAFLQDIVRDLMGGRANKKLVERCALSIVGQCSFYHHARPVVTRLYPQLRYEAKDIEALADHITSFSLAALKEFRKQGKR